MQARRQKALQLNSTLNNYTVFGDLPQTVLEYFLPKLLPSVFKNFLSTIRVRLGSTSRYHLISP